MGAFNSQSSIPYSDVNLKDKAGRPPNWGPDSSLAEVATIQLEFNDLSHALVNPIFQVCYKKNCLHECHYYYVIICSVKL